MSFSQSSLGSGSDFHSVALSGSTGIAGSESTGGIYYTTDGGATWSISNRNRGFFNPVALNGLTGIAGSDSTGGIYYTTDGGQTWSISNVTTGSFFSVALNGLTGIAGSNSELGIYYTTDGGATWSISNVNSGNFLSVALSSDGLTGIAGSGSTGGIYYTTDGGATWSISNRNRGFFNPVALNGLTGIAGSDSTGGIYYTTDGGQTWSISNVTTGSFFSVAISSRSVGIAGSNSGLGIYYISSPLCFNEGTKILCLNNLGEEEYIAIENLRKGDLVKSYKHGYRKIDLIGKKDMINDANYIDNINGVILRNCMHKMIKTPENSLIEDLIITGHHSVLVDDLGEYKEKMDTINKYFSNPEKIEDKYLLLSSISNEFVKIEDVKIFTYYHLCLENDGNNKDKFGIWANGILVETTNKHDFILSNFSLL